MKPERQIRVGGLRNKRLSKHRAFLLALCILPLTLASMTFAQGQGGPQMRKHTATKVQTFRLVPTTQKLSVKNSQSDQTVGNKRILKSNGIPAHRVGIFPNQGNPHTITEQNYRFSVPAYPKPATGTTKRLVAPLGSGSMGTTPMSSLREPITTTACLKIIWLNSASVKIVIRHRSAGRPMDFLFMHYTAIRIPKIPGPQSSNYLRAIGLSEVDALMEMTILEVSMMVLSYVIMSLLGAVAHWMNAMGVSVLHRNFPMVRTHIF